VILDYDRINCIL